MSAHHLIISTRHFFEQWRNWLCIVSRIQRSIFISPRAIFVGSDIYIGEGSRIKDRVKGIVIEDNVWIGVRAIILDGVRIGAGSVVAAGAIVTRDVPMSVVVAGFPTRVIRMRNIMQGQGDEAL